MRGALLGFLLVVTLVFGASHASAIIYWVMGPFSAVGIEQDGSQTHMVFGQNLPRPEWVPVSPGASVVQAATLTSARAASELSEHDLVRKPVPTFWDHARRFHSLDLSTRASLEQVKRFYTDELTASGFAVEDLGIAPLNPMTAAYLGMAGTLAGKRVATDDMIHIQIRTADGLIPARLLQIRWAKMRDYPAHAQ